MALTKVTTGTISDGAIESLKGRNLIINGAMQVAQRGTSVSGVTSGTVNYDTADRFFNFYSGGGVYDEAVVSDAPDGFSKSLKITTSTADGTLDAGDRFNVSQRIEGQNIQHLNFGSSEAKEFTVSFWVKSSVTGVYALEIWQYDGSKHFTKTYTISSADTWEYKTLTYTANTSDTVADDNTAGIGAIFFLRAGSTYNSGTASGTWNTTDGERANGQTADIGAVLNSTWQITGLQLEVGSVATSFEHETFGETLQKCQRYYQKSYDVGSAPGSTDNSNYVCMIQMANSATSTANAGARTRFVQRLRAAPSVTVYAPDGTSGNLNYTRHGTGQSEVAATVSNIGSTSVLVYTSSASGMTAGDAIEVFFHYTADAEL